MLPDSKKIFDALPAYAKPCLISRISDYKTQIYVYISEPLRKIQI